PGRLGQGRFERMASIKTLVLEYMDREGAAHIRWLTHADHHHGWMPKGRGMLFNDRKTVAADGRKKDPRMHLIDQPIGSHPGMDPACRMIADFDEKAIFVVQIDEQRVERVATYRKRCDMSRRGVHVRTACGTPRCRRSFTTPPRPVIVSCIW
ncbi:MAG: hypothetical protein JXL80_02765, partial [Planctomycetes bacterium]|nr:hypothetical protein [Planctomycetota bacterium]